MGDNNFEKGPELPKIVHEEIEKDLGKEKEIAEMSDIAKKIKEGKNSTEDIDRLGKLIEKYIPKL